MEKQIRQREIPCEGFLRLRASEDADSRVIEGRAIVFNRPSVPLYDDGHREIREQISPSAVTQELLDSSDILMTLYHDNSRILGRSLNGKGTLSYTLGQDGVDFSFEAPRTSDGDTALALVRSGDINGCSFAFLMDLSDDNAETRTVEQNGEKTIITYTVNRIRDIRDFTLTPRPAYRDTAVASRKRDFENAHDHEALPEVLNYTADVERIRRIIES